MLYYLHHLSDYAQVMNVTRYITFRTAAASLSALAIGLFLGPFFIRKLRELPREQLSGRSLLKVVDELSASELTFDADALRDRELLEQPRTERVRQQRAAAEDHEVEQTLRAAADVLRQVRVDEDVDGREEERVADAVQHVHGDD